MPSGNIGITAMRATVRGVRAPAWRHATRCTNASHRCELGRGRAGRVASPAPWRGGPRSGGRRSGRSASRDALSSSENSIAPPPSSGTYPDSVFTAGGSALYGALPSVPVLAASLPASGESVKMSASVPDTPATGRPAPNGSVGECRASSPTNSAARGPVVVAQPRAVGDHDARHRQPRRRSSVDVITAMPASRVPAPPLANAELLDQQLGRVVVARREHLLDDVAHRRRLHRAEHRVRRRGAVPSDGAAADGDAPCVQQLRQLGRRRQRRVGGPLRVAGDAGVVDDQRVVRAGLDAADVVDPARREVLVVVARAVADHPPWICVTPAAASASASASSDVGVVTGLGSFATGYVELVEQRVAAADEVEVAGDDAADRRRGGPHLRRVPVVGAEHLEGDVAGRAASGCWPGSAACRRAPRRPGRRRPRPTTHDGVVQRRRELGDRGLERRQADVAATARRAPDGTTAAASPASATAAGGATVDRRRRLVGRRRSPPPTATAANSTAPGTSASTTSTTIGLSARRRRERHDRAITRPVGPGSGRRGRGGRGR